MFEKFEKHFSSRRKILFVLFAIALVLSIPFTFSQLSNQYEIRQRASEIETQFGPAASISGTSSANNIVPQATGDCPAEHPGLDTEEKKMVELHNQYRQSKGLAPFNVSQKLNVVAANLAEDEAINGYSAHVNSKGENMDVRFPNCGLPLTTSYGENAGRSETTQAMFDAWVASPGHNENILGGSCTGCNYSAMGVARVKAQNQSGYIWITDFATVNPGGSPTNDNSTDDNNSSPIPDSPTPTTMGSTISPTPFDNESQSPTPTISGTSLSLNLSLPGIGTDINIGENNNPNPGTVGGIVKLFNSETGEETQNIPITLTYSTGSGAFTTSFNVPVGTHDIKVNTDNSLIKDLGVIQINTGSNSTNPEILTTGDINQDNILDLLDYNIFISCFGTKSCSEKAIADLNLDGYVNEIDLNIFYSGLASRNGD